MGGGRRERGESPLTHRLVADSKLVKERMNLNYPERERDAP
ncbi:hypothetical protein RB2225 [Rhodopirellula baltica SH 1]|uniref:Uncharacterized protein n=1 Tax=Rhodopirellula baltica (strain DSM 10527 / NCIMB 13988 / SH1) TaxID=243090 RepID=Q7UW72_RHOBA|nr:hypothetical protein RB2225 [Rhodopirellula baltica SH 1]